MNTTEFFEMGAASELTKGPYGQQYELEGEQD